MNKLYVIVILCLLIMAGCCPKTIKFPHETSLDQQLMSLQGITNPIRVDIKYPYLILQNMKLQDSLFHVYNLSDQKLVCAFGTKGQGPKEYAAPWLFQTQTSNVLIGDIGKRQINYYNIDKGFLLQNSKNAKYINGINDAAFINDSLFIIDDKYTGPNIQLLNIDIEIPLKTWCYRNSNILDYMADPNMGNVYANENRIVFCYGYKKQIDFMDINFNLIKRLNFDNSVSQIKNTSEGQGDEKICYVYAYLGKKYLYALFLGTSWNENRANSTCETILEVFDLNGNPKAKYHLKGRRPVYFAVDEENSVLYGAGENGEPEDHLIVYHLNALS